MRNTRLRNETEFSTGFNGGSVGTCAILEASHVWGGYGGDTRV
jgi:hypothetical protein